MNSKNINPMQKHLIFYFLTAVATGLGGYLAGAAGQTTPECAPPPVVAKRSPPRLNVVPSRDTVLWGDMFTVAAVPTYDYLVLESAGYPTEITSSTLHYLSFAYDSKAFDTLADPDGRVAIRFEADLEDTIDGTSRLVEYLYLTDVGKVRGKRMLVLTTSNDPATTTSICPPGGC